MRAYFVAETVTSTTHTHTHTKKQHNINALSGIRPLDPSSWAVNLHLIPHGHLYRLLDPVLTVNLNNVTDNRFPAINNKHHLDNSHSLRAGLSAARSPICWDFLHMSTAALGLTQPPVQRITVLSPGGKAPGAWRWLSTPERAQRLKKE
jgi:hypothetical protein